MKKKFTWLSFAIILAYIGFTLLIVNFIWIVFVNRDITTYVYPIDFELAANIGSYIGGVIGVFWSGAGVILIYATFKKQQEFNENQAFEQTFQNLMSSYYTIVNSIREKVAISINEPPKDSIGREFFSDFIKKIKKSFDDTQFIGDVLQAENIPEVTEFKSRKKIQANQNLNLYVRDFSLELMVSQSNKNDFSKELTMKRYEYFYEKYQNSLGHYFRFIYNTFKLIIENKELESDRKKYINLIQAHMSNDELGVLFYNALSKYAVNKKGESKFKKWLEDYDFFENIDEQSILSKIDAKYYDIDYKFNHN